MPSWSTSSVTQSLESDVGSMALCSLMHFARTACLTLLLLSGACSGEPSYLLQEQPESAADFYGDDHVWHIDLHLDSSNLERLGDDPRSYVEGDIRIGDAWVRNVGIRLKGQFSFQGLGGKPSFKIKFNRFRQEQRFLGLEKLTLNNMRQDRSQVHEWLAYRIFRAAGVPAPRSSYARITVNGELYGLYANVETMDDRFLDDRFDAPGNLYEAPWGADLDEDSVDLFEQDEGDDSTRQDLNELVLRVAQPGDAVFFANNAPIDTDEFLRFMASEALVGHWDGYWKSNNYFLYHDLGNDQWSFHPWGLDQSFDRDLQPFTSAGVLARKCIALPSCRSEYTRIGNEVLAAVEALDLGGALDELSAKLQEYVDEDPRSPHPLDKALRFQEIVQARLSATPTRLGEQFDCMEDGVEQDRDGDGFLGCQRDCDDYDDSRYPSAIESCDGVDNNCDGLVDELGCECEAMDLDGSTLHFCLEEIRWSAARDACQERGLRLADLDSVTFARAAFEFADELAPNRSWYLAGNDREEEGSWRRLDQEPLDFANFGPGEPDDFGDEDCAVLASYANGDWADVRCNTALPYICQEID